LILAAVILPACSSSDSGGDIVAPPEEENLRPPLSNLGEFPAGPHSPVAGDIYTYNVERTWDTTPGDGQVEQTALGTLRITVGADTTFGVWSSTIPVTRMQRVGGIVDSTVTWFRFDTGAENQISYGAIGLFSNGTIDEFTDLRPLLTYPLTTPEEGPDSLANWVDGWVEITRWYHGRDDLVTLYDIDVLRSGLCADSTSICEWEELWQTVSGTVEAYRVTDIKQSEAAQVVEESWWGRDGMLQSVTTSVGPEQTVVTTAVLAELRVRDPN
jgi:hypothetical protein